MENTTIQPEEKVGLEITPVENTPLAPEPSKSKLQLLAEAKMKEIQEQNPEFQVDFMNVFSRLRIDSKGRFMYTLAGEDFVLGDAIVVQLLAGEYMYQLWDSEDNMLICHSAKQYVNMDGELCASCPHNNGDGPHPDCKIRYALALHVLDGKEDPEALYILNAPSTGAYAFADYIKLLNRKHLKVAEVKTEIRTEEKTSTADSSKKFNAILFKYVG